MLECVRASRLVTRTSYHILWFLSYNLYRFYTCVLHVFQPTRNVWNDPAFLAIPTASAHGVSSAAGFAKLMGILAGGGSHQGRPLLSPKTVAMLAEPLTPREPDLTMKLESMMGRSTVLFKTPRVCICVSVISFCSLTSWIWTQIEKGARFQECAALTTSKNFVSFCQHFQSFHPHFLMCIN